MACAFHHPIFDEPDALDSGARPKRFKVAPTFVIDLCFSALSLAGVVPVFRAALDSAFPGVCRRPSAARDPRLLHR